MHFVTIFLLFASLAFVDSAATGFRYVDTSHRFLRRTYAEHWPLRASVANCTNPQTTIQATNTTASVSVADCNKVLANVRYNHGYYEVWGFDSNGFAPVTGFQTCVFAVATTGANVTDGYAVIGNDDVVTAIVEAIGAASATGNITGSSGTFTCGPNNATLSLLIYNGLNGYNSSYASAPIVNMFGDTSGMASVNTSAPKIPGMATEVLGRR